MKDSTLTSLAAKGLVRPGSPNTYSKYYVPEMFWLRFTATSIIGVIEYGFELVSIVPAFINRVDLFTQEGQEIKSILEKTFKESLPEFKQNSHLYEVESEFSEQTIYKHRFICLVSPGVDELDSDSLFVVKVDTPTSSN